MASGWRVVEDEAHERVADRPLHPVGNVEVDAGQVRHGDFARLVTHREVIARAVVEVPYAGDAHPIAIDEGARHNRDVGPPVAVVRRQDQRPPDQKGGEQGSVGSARARLAREPKRPDAEDSERDRKRGSHPGLGQVREVDRERRPAVDEHPQHEPEHRREAAGDAEEQTHAGGDVGWTGPGRPRREPNRSEYTRVNSTPNRKICAE